MAILIVEDEKSVRQMLRRVLERQHPVLEAETVQEAREALEIQPVELILCDIGLAGESGMELVRTVAEEDIDTAIVMVTGLDDPEIAKEAIDMGAYGYLVKPFTPNEVRITVDAALRRRELEQARARLEEQERELRLISDRERIGRDLHDTVIQRLFATGLLLQSASALITNDAARQRVEKAVDELDVTIRQIRTAIFEIESPEAHQLDSVRTAVVERVRDTGALLGFQPRVVFSGAVDSNVAGDVVDHLLATLQESLSNVVRHASARSVEVHVTVDNDVILRVRDDGVGIRKDQWGSGGLGLANMRARAERLGGSFSIVARQTGGTDLEWRVPLVPPASPSP